MFGKKQQIKILEIRVRDLEERANRYWRVIIEGEKRLGKIEALLRKTEALLSENNASYKN